MYEARAYGKNNMQAKTNALRWETQIWRKPTKVYLFLLVAPLNKQLPLGVCELNR